jgi:hypothetical protein
MPICPLTGSYPNNNSFLLSWRAFVGPEESTSLQKPPGCNSFPQVMQFLTNLSFLSQHSVLLLASVTLIGSKENKLSSLNSGSACHLSPLSTLHWTLSSILHLDLLPDKNLWNTMIPCSYLSPRGNQGQFLPETHHSTPEDGLWASSVQFTANEGEISGCPLRCSPLFISDSSEVPFIGLGTVLVLGGGRCC